MDRDISFVIAVGQVLNLVAKPDKETATTAHLSWNSPASRTSVQVRKPFSPPTGAQNQEPTNRRLALLQ